jgi:CRP-like cAMP-binding protein
MSSVAARPIDFDFAPEVCTAWKKDQAQATIRSWLRRQMLSAPVRYKAGSRIVHPDPGPGGMLLLDRGLVGLERARCSGPQSPLFALCFPGQLFGQPNHGPVSDSYVAIALIPCVVYSISSFQLTAALKKGGDDALFILQQYSENLLLAGARAMAVSTKSARARFELLLRELAEVLDSRTLRGSIGLPLKDKDIAGLLGITPGQLSVIKKQMAGARVISFSQKRNELLMKSSSGMLRFCKMNYYRRRFTSLKQIEIQSAIVSD